MSVDFPYISEKEAENLDHLESNNIPESKVGPSTTNGDSGANLGDKKSNRGGILLHKPGKEMREFSKYIKPFIMSTDKQVNSTISNEAWIQHMYTKITSNEIGPFKIINLQSDSLDAAQFIGQYTYWRPDIVFLDSGHRKGITFLELEEYFALLPVGGIIVGDDWNWIGVREDVLKFKKKYKKLISFSLVRGHCSIENQKCYYFYVIQRLIGEE